MRNHFASFSIAKKQSPESLIITVQIGKDSFFDLQFESEMNSKISGYTIIKQDLIISSTESSVNDRFDFFFLENDEEKLCYKEAIKDKNWSKECAFLNDRKRKTFLNKKDFIYKFEVDHLLDFEFNNTMIIIDNSPFPYNKTTSEGAIEVSIMKENIYTSSMNYYTASYCLILVFSMLFIILLGTLVKFYRVNVSLKRDVEQFKTSFQIKTMPQSFIAHFSVLDKTARFPTLDGSRYQSKNKKSSNSKTLKVSNGSNNSSRKQSKNNSNLSSQNPTPTNQQTKILNGKKNKRDSISEIESHINSNDISHIENGKNSINDISKIGENNSEYLIGVSSNSRNFNKSIFNNSNTFNKKAINRINSTRIQEDSEYQRRDFGQSRISQDLRKHEGQYKLNSFNGQQIFILNFNSMLRTGGSKKLLSKENQLIRHKDRINSSMISENSIKKIEWNSDSDFENSSDEDLSSKK
ncbi:UNKNOWN [Stylonychia lemnae]|uniref:Transmembrane protein n=1 Tax=Stylonychia lemnae TaxID=5949 RepID=A0A078BBM6_STYLE|nr:UNKNOWN [Stylonychia lemnae]|eukprot:CDW90667.1 UNKNOWN [Stylonychia lemnae]